MKPALPRYLLLAILPLCLLMAGCGTSISTASSSSSATAISVSANPTTVATGSVTTLIAVVSNSAGSAFAAPTGYVTFIGNSGITLGTGELAADTDGYSSTATLSEPASSLSSGANVITATYGGDQFHSASATTSSITVTVSAGGTGSANSTTTTLVASSSTVALGGQVSLVASVTAPNGTTTPTGQVEFVNLINGATLGTQILQGSGTIAFAAISITADGTNLIEGTNYVIAEYLPGSNTYTGSSSYFATIDVGSGTGASGSTTTNLSGEPTSITVNESTILTATVTAVSGGSVPSGNVAFVDDETGSTLATVPLNASGQATLAVAGNEIGIGVTEITAEYTGNGSSSISFSDPVAITVGSGSGGGVDMTTTGITASATTIPSTGETMLTATVTGTGSTVFPTGTVTFYDPDANPTTYTIPVADTGTPGKVTAVLPVEGSQLAVGANIIYASYSGDKIFNGSTGQVTVTVTGAGGTGTYTSAVTTSPDSLSMRVDKCASNMNIDIVGYELVQGFPNPTGTLTLSVNKRLIGTQYLVAGGGYNGTSFTGWTLCSSSSNPLSVAGSYSLVLSYSGDVNYLPSSTSVPVTVSN